MKRSPEKSAVHGGATFDEAVAIVGLGAVFPGARNLQDFWRIVEGGVDTSRSVPAGRWVLDPKEIQSNTTAPDRVYTDRGCFIEDFQLDRTGLNLPAELLANVDLSVHLLLEAGRNALNNADLKGEDLERIGVVMGNIALPTEGSSDLSEAILKPLLAGEPIGKSFKSKAWNRYVAGLPAGLLAQALGLGGGAYTLDAACASSLYALKLACDELLAGRSDVMLAGGLSRPDSLYTQMGFCQLRALSQTGRCSPFDVAGDGLLVGEGAGVLVLKRLSDAIADGDRIRAVIRGIGLSNDLDGNLLSPSSEGQVRALQQAYQQAGWTPDQVDLIECHATGTPVGDAVEFESLMKLWQGKNWKAGQCVLGAVKANIGHLLTAAGSASLIKTILALENNILPATANFHKASAKIPLAGSPFEILKTSVPWRRRDETTPRRAAINGFGFGGINAHVLIEEWVGEISNFKFQILKPPIINSPVAIVGMAATVGPWSNLAAFQERVFGGDMQEVPAERKEFMALEKERHFPGYFLDDLAIPANRYRIPPKEIGELLPQQALMLEVAREALRDAKTVQPEASRVGVFIGLGLDLRTTDFHFRWSTLHEREDNIPALTADRTLGALAGINASRIAKEFHFGGPCHTVCNEDCSGARALEIAVRALQKREVDQALAGGVDLTGDLRAMLATESLRHNEETIGEGAVALVLKRLDDAVRDGDRVYAVVSGLGASSGNAALAQERAYAEAKVDRAFVRSIDSAAAEVGHTGAASGLVSVAKAALALYHEVIPSKSPQYWVRNKADGARRAGVSVSSIDGNHAHVVLEAFESAKVLSKGRPLELKGEALFVVRAADAAGLAGELKSLQHVVASSDGEALTGLARDCWLRSNAASGPSALALVAQDAAQLMRLTEAAILLVQGEGMSSEARDRDRIFYSSPGKKISGGIAFVFPGAGAHFQGMGRELALLWPEILCGQDRENKFLAKQMFTDRFWNGVPPEDATDPRPAICAQVSLGAMMSDLAVHLGIKPEASIGYSLGESTALFALRAWKARDEMLGRFCESPLFSRDLKGPPEWRTGVVDRSAEVVRQAIGKNKRVYILIINTPNECLLGGNDDDLRALVKTLGCHWYPIEGVSTVHCDLLKPVQKAYREMHLFDTEVPSGIRFFSTALGGAFALNKDSAADTITAQAGSCVDFPRVIRAAYESGIRFFIEMGPGNSCSQMIGQILSDKPHVARSLCASAQEPLLGVLRVLAHLVANGVPVDLQKLYGDAPAPVVAEKGVPMIRIPIISPVYSLERRASARHEVKQKQAAITVSPRSIPVPAAASVDSFEEEFIAAMAQSQAATLSAHKAYLDFSQNLAETLSKNIESQINSIAAWSGGSVDTYLPSPTVPPSSSPPFMDREACLEFARGLVSKVLGSEFAPVDKFPTRVRLPDEPLMLVDRITEVEGEARSMTHGRVVTEHDIHPGAWYLDGGRIPTCIAVEAGQADLFLSGYLGIDFITKGLAVYRLLDAKVCFHQGLPGPGKVIRYDIKIKHFFRQSDTWLFRFEFESTVDGQPLLTMTDGCAGFFSAEALASGKGIVKTAMDLKPYPGKRPADWEDFVPMTVESYTTEQLDALRTGNLTKCFGPQFSKLPLKEPATLPDGLMKLVHRIPHLDPKGGQFGLGLIRGEADIHPTDWFLTCHFVDDRVMPGTLMFECCMHTLRVFLLRMGWIVEKDQAVLEPVPGVVSQLKCRGQVLETTKIVTYEISIKELGYGPEPFVIADALMYADGKPIVEITNMSLRYAGVTCETFREAWSAQNALGRARHSARAEVDIGTKPGALGQTRPTFQNSANQAIYNHDRILAYAIGKPSDAFGAPYQIFDEKRKLARLPGPPYLFLDCITEVQGEPFKMTPGGVAVADYTVPPEEWYFAENRQADMPFAVLLEIALQPCGWLAAYVGSALTAKDVDVSFRNLGGNGQQFIRVTPETGTLTTRVKMTRTSSSAGMIIQWFDLEVRCAAGVVYKGDTYFGFFPAAALAKQEGIQNAALYQVTPTEMARAKSLAYPAQSPYAGTQLRMMDNIETYVADGGAKGLGFIRGTKRVNPDEWFFKAHFYQDPVMPGSLGLEAFVQLLKYVAVERWGHAAGAHWETVASNQPHSWIYRGQVIPPDHLVTVEATVTKLDNDAKLLTADGFLSVDGRVIYEMKNFTIQRRGGESAK